GREAGCSGSGGVGRGVRRRRGRQRPRRRCARAVARGRGRRAMADARRAAGGPVRRARARPGARSRVKRDLYGRLFEASAFPLLDRISGTSISAVFAALEAAEHLDRDEIAARQTRKLAVTVELARRASPFYRELWTTAGPRSSHPVLDGLPVVTKAQLAAAPEAFPLPGFRGRVVTSRTSGSTGSPMVFHRSLEQESWFWALRFRIWSWAGYRPGDPYLTINLNPRLGWRKHLQDVLFRCAYLTFNADNQDSARIVARLSADGIRHLNGFSSSLYV